MPPCQPCSSELLLLACLLSAELLLNDFHPIASVDNMQTLLSAVHVRVCASAGLTYLCHQARQKAVCPLFDSFQIQAEVPGFRACVSACPESGAGLGLHHPS